MTCRIIAFAVCCIIGLGFIAFGIYARGSKKPIGFWAGDKVTDVSDLKAYNCAVSTLYCVFGAILILLGIPMLANILWGIFTTVGVALETIITMAVYATKIEGKYRK